MRDFQKGEATWIRNRLLRWFDSSGRKFPWRRPSATRYEQVLSEVLLQRTRAETVAALFRQFVRDYPSWRRLSAASVDDLERYLRPLGLWRRRARVLVRLSGRLAQRRGRMPRTRAEIERLPGVGQYVANAITLFCFDGRTPLLDSNMSRVLERYFGPRKLADIRDDPHLQKIAHRVVNTRHAICVNWAILDLGALVCRPTQPRCRSCPLMQRCTWSQENTRQNSAPL